MREHEERILANGRVDGHERELLRRRCPPTARLTDGGLPVELHKRVQHRTPGFEQFFYKAIQDHILADGRISAEEA